MKIFNVIKHCSAVLLLMLLTSQVGFSQQAAGRLVLSNTTFGGPNWESTNWNSPSNELAQLRFEDSLSVADYSVTFSATGYGPTQGPSPFDQIGFFFGQDDTQENYYTLTYFPVTLGSGLNVVLTKVLANAPNVTLGTARIPSLENDEVYTWQVIKEAQSGKITVNLDRGGFPGYVLIASDTSFSTLGHFGWTRQNAAPKRVTIQKVEVRDLSDASAVVSFTLVNAATGQPIPGFDPIPANAVIDPIKLPAFSIRANTNPAQVGSVRFSYDLRPEYKVENVVPYSLTGDFDNGTRYNPFRPAPGVQTLTATPFSGASLTGTIGTARSLSFIVEYTYEAENASPSFVGFPRVTDENPGFSGTGYMDFGNNFGEYIQWNQINIPTNNGPDTFTLVFRYANGGATDRPLDLSANGRDPIRVSFPPTGGWASWSTVSVDVPLIENASQSIRLTSVNSTGPNIDYLQINGVGTVATETNARTAESNVKPTGASELILGGKELLVYPNPATEQLTVEATGSEDYQVTVYDMTGRRMMQQDHLKGKTTLDIRHLRPGIYLIKLRDQQQREGQHRILIE